ncbi:shikimate dehydrogenase family protein [Jannaschia marina]|uniref:shikimate dehydrogenase family protein n=1 Tax=Jannaschia marina TaxID=2741674 RepID=UPI0015CDEF3E|nr:NAD(P)-binding domain-containing protein [Jannaschia marina]
MNTLVCGLIGENIGNSRLSRALELMCADAGIDFRFTLIDTKGVAEFDFDAQVDLCRADGWTGVTVTHPWKTHAARWAGDAMVAGTRDLGAANTLTFVPRRGHNTDYTGFRAAYAHVLDRPPGAVAVAGAGGVARAVVPALVELGAGPVRIWDRDAERARALARDTGAEAIAIEDAAGAVAEAEGLVNCTPMGMAPYGGSAFDKAWLGPQAWAFDAVYTPTDTPFLIAAADAGLAVMTGFDLFRFMAMQSFEAYTGRVPDPAATLPKLDTLRPR